MPRGYPGSGKAKPQAKTPREPKAYTQAKLAYNAFWNEQPQIFFEELAHSYQMRWVKAIRAIKTRS